MNQQEATEFVIQQLGKHRQKNDIIQKLCESTRMNWSQAEKFIQQVEAQHSDAIVQKQSPMIVAIGTFILVAGLIVTVIAVYATLTGQNMRLRGLPIPYAGNIVYLIGGIAMMGGAVRGMWDTIVRLWNS